MQDNPVPVIVIDDTPVKRRGVYDFVEETPQLCLHAQAMRPMRVYDRNSLRILEPSNAATV